MAGHSAVDSNVYHHAQIREQDRKWLMYHSMEILLSRLLRSVRLVLSSWPLVSGLVLLQCRDMFCAPKRRHR